MDTSVEHILPARRYTCARLHLVSTADPNYLQTGLLISFKLQPINTCPLPGLHHHQVHSMKPGGKSMDADTSWGDAKEMGEGVGMGGQG